jgi:hypothetical protein
MQGVYELNEAERYQASRIFTHEAANTLIRLTFPVTMLFLVIIVSEITRKSAHDIYYWIGEEVGESSHSLSEISRLDLRKYVYLVIFVGEKEVNNS